jgi:formylglycine-generating enzyme
MYNLALLLAVVLPLPAAAQAAGNGGVRAPAGMVWIDGGEFRPLFAQPGERIVAVISFALDTLPVTRGEFLEFVRSNPSWRADRVPALFAGPGYLQDWPAPLAAGDADALARPVTNVSWFAAKAYCEARGARLPTTAEWEYAARASETDPDAARNAAFRQRVLDLMLGATPAAGFRNAWGARELHGSLSEWVLDFNTIFAAGDSRDGGLQDKALTCALGAAATGDSADYAAFLRYSLRAAIQGRTTSARLGFRCAADS